MINILTWISKTLFFGKSLDETAIASRELASKNLWQTLLFAFSPFLIGLFGIFFRADKMINTSVLEELWSAIATGGIYSISAALLAPIWFAARSENVLVNKDAFQAWVIIILLVCAVAIGSEQSRVQINSWTYLGSSLFVLIIVSALFFSSDAFGHESRQGSITETTSSADTFAEEFTAFVKEAD